MEVKARLFASEGSSEISLEEMVVEDEVEGDWKEIAEYYKNRYK